MLKKEEKKLAPVVEVDPVLGEVEVRTNDEEGFEDEELKEEAGQGPVERYLAGKKEDTRPDLSEYKFEEPNKHEPNRKHLQKRKSSKAPLRKGQIAHYHNRENSKYEIETVECKAVEYRVRSKHGLRINEHLYVGPVVVPQCVANYLVGMDQEHRRNEEAIHTNRGRSIELGEVG
jgi:hypothetical protein